MTRRISWTERSLGHICHGARATTGHRWLFAAIAFHPSGASLREGGHTTTQCRKAAEPCWFGAFRPGSERVGDPSGKRAAVTTTRACRPCKYRRRQSAVTWQGIAAVPGRARRRSRRERGTEQLRTSEWRAIRLANAGARASCVPAQHRIEGRGEHRPTPNGGERLQSRRATRPRRPRRLRGAEAGADYATRHVRSRILGVSSPLRRLATTGHPSGRSDCPHKRA